MKTMKILVVDDTVENIEAAKIAAQLFPQQFTFMTSANEAFKQIESFDAVITDLFFPEKPGDEMMESYENMQTVYSKDNELCQSIMDSYYTTECVEKNLSIVRNGLTISNTTRKPLDKPEFPLGIAIMLKANRKCLISDLHAHGASDGEILLLPLVKRSYTDQVRRLNKEVIGQDGVGSLYYIGRNRMDKYLRNNTDERRGKENPLIWEKAIHCVLAQE